VASTTSLTIDDFERLPAEAVRNRELVDGELVDVSGNTAIHNKVRDRLIAQLLWWLNQNHTGDAIAEQGDDFLGNAHGPDVSYYGAEKLPRRQSEARAVIRARPRRRDRVGERHLLEPDAKEGRVPPCRNQ
jgi:Uma2 family endonuclease